MAIGIQSFSKSNMVVTAERMNFKFQLSLSGSFSIALIIAKNGIRLYARISYVCVLQDDNMSSVLQRHAFMASSKLQNYGSLSKIV